MNLRFFSFLFGLAVFALASCGDDEAIFTDCQINGCPQGFSCAEVNGSFVCIEDTPVNVVKVTDNISSDATWTADKTYILAGRIAVTDGATLTIEPGTLIKGEAGTGAAATALLVARGGKLMACGTPEAPIIFTATADEIRRDNIVVGNFASPNLDPTVSALWGGVIVLGKAPISVEGDFTEVQIEGIPTSDANGLYGGNDPSDNSGKIQYVSIRHGGANIGSGNEINGLTLGGVGSETVIDNIEIIGNQDDGMEWFGGTVNATNVIVWNAGDDAIDTDQAWSGTLDNFVVITTGDACFELDGPEGSLPGTHVIMNGSVVAADEDRTSAKLIDLDDDSMVDLKNIFITGIEAGQQVFSPDAPASSFENVAFTFSEGVLEDYFDGSVPAGASEGGVPQADLSVFNWTWAAKSGGLDGL